jgi:hypothetical protein
LSDEMVQFLHDVTQLRLTVEKSVTYHQTLTVNSPLCIEHLLYRCKVRFRLDDAATVDMTPIDYCRVVKSFWDAMIRDRLISKNNLLFRVYFHEWFNPTSLVVVHRLTREALHWTLSEVTRLLRMSRVHTGESVGMVAAHSLGEPFTQMTLKTPHIAGKFSGTMSGAEKVENIIDCNFSRPTMRIFLQPSVKSKLGATRFAMSIVACRLVDIAKNFPTYRFIPCDNTGQGYCEFNLSVDRPKAVCRNISAVQLIVTLNRKMGFPFEWFDHGFSDDSEWRVNLRVPTNHKIWLDFKTLGSDMTITANAFSYNLYFNTVVQGNPKLCDFRIDLQMIKKGLDTNERWVVTTFGTDLASVVTRPEVDTSRLVSTDGNDMAKVFGKHAARRMMIEELTETMSGMADERHVELICRYMTKDFELQGMKIRDLGKSIPPLQRAAYEQSAKQITAYCYRAERDYSHTICGAAITNKMFQVGTGFRVGLYEDRRTLRYPARLVVPRLSYEVFSPNYKGEQMCLFLFRDSDGTDQCRFVATDGRMFCPSDVNIDPPCSDVFTGTVLEGRFCESRSGFIGFLVRDCHTVCGNPCGHLRYDHRLEIAREVVYRFLVPGPDLTTPGSTRVRVRKVNLGVDCPAVLPIHKRTVVSREGYALFGSNIFVSVTPIFRCDGLQEFKDFWQKDLSFPYEGFSVVDVRDPVRLGTRGM